MAKSILKMLFKSWDEKLLKKIEKIQKEINKLEDSFIKMSDDELSQQTKILKEEYSTHKDLDKLLTRAFATVRETSKRILSMRHFDVQLLGGIILHQGLIAEMKTGEGKTLVATLAMYLNTLSGDSVHVVTANDYLAMRDSNWMGKIFRFLRLKVSCIVNSMDDSSKKEAYQADIIYGTNNEFGFDYLRDNMKHHADELIQGELNFAIVDEVDSILIDEARTPLIISGNMEDKTNNYRIIDQIIPGLAKEHYEVNEKNKSAELTEEGFDFVEKEMKEKKYIKEESSLYDLENTEILNHVNIALKAHKIFICDVDYIIKDDKIIIIDEFTGRMMEGRRFSDGLHQAIEAKEEVHIQSENQTLASITFQNYFRMYKKLAGMTGTAKTEEKEFANIYGLKVVTIPTNVPVNRIDEEDEIYKTKQEKYNALVVIIEEAHKKQQPVLVGTTNIDKSEELSKLLSDKGLKHNVLNARYHQEEAFIIAQAGQPKAITIATNMAGRGTDIQLGGNADMLIAKKLANIEDEVRKESEIENITKQIEEDRKTVLEAGGLYVIGTERHESRRIDNQLRGRSGRQGDPGKSKFLLSLEDDLLRIFGSDNIKNLLVKFGLKDGESITHPWVTNALEKAQIKIESKNFDIRKSLLRFDDIINEQRSLIYNQRTEIVLRSNFDENYKVMMESLNTTIIRNALPSNPATEEIDIDSIKNNIYKIYALDLDLSVILDDEDFSEEKLYDHLNKETQKILIDKETSYGKEIVQEIQKSILLSVLDMLWCNHMKSLEYLKQGINFRAIAQKDPINEFKKETFALFEQIPHELTERVLTYFAHAKIKNVNESDSNPDNNEELIDTSLPQKESFSNISRNAKCPCGSGKRFKHCHGKL